MADEKEDQMQNTAEQMGKFPTLKEYLEWYCGVKTRTLTPEEDAHIRKLVRETQNTRAKEEKGTPLTLDEMLFQIYGIRPEGESNPLTPEELAYLAKHSEERKQRRQAEGRKAEQEDA